MPIDRLNDGTDPPEPPSEGGFLSRWSQRKQQARRGEVPEQLSDPMESAGAPPATHAQEMPLPEPTLREAEQLTSESDFSRFVSAGVKPDVKNMALKKLFTDKHFNQMDGLDIYIDDYGIADPLPEGWLEKMEHVKGWLIPREPETPVQAGIDVQADAIDESVPGPHADVDAPSSEAMDPPVQDNMSRHSQSD